MGISSVNLHQKYLIPVLLSIFLFSVTVGGQLTFASSDGGGGRGEPLTLADTSIVDGMIKPDESIILTFSNNVINEDVRENNAKAFSMYDSGGNEVSIEVIIPDEQINPDAKRIIEVKPASSLEEGAAYTLVVSKEIRAKNGAQAEVDYQIGFMVAGSGTAAGSVGNSPASGAATGSSAPTNTSGSGSSKLNDLSIAMFACAGIAVCILIIVFMKRKKSAS